MLHRPGVMKIRRRSSIAAVIVYAVVDNALSRDFPLGVELEVFVRRQGSRTSPRCRRSGGRLGRRVSAFMQPPGLCLTAEPACR